MSADAETYVQTLTHPKVKGGTRALLLAIATHVPEGQTTTPPLTLDDLAAAAQHTARTAQTCRNLLEALGLIRVHDGGRGNKARYELLALDGTRPIVAAPLPLLGPAKPRRAKEQRSTSDLFSYVSESDLTASSEETAINVGSFFLRFATVLKKVGSFFLRWRPSYDQTAKNVGSFFLRWRDQAKEQRSTSDPTFAAHIDRARDVRTTTTTSTTTARATTNAPPLASRPPPPIHSWHAWCEGRVHMPKKLHADFVQRLGRRAGETDADLEARAFTCYAAELATIPSDAPIPILNEFEFWRPRFAGMLGAAAPARDPTIYQVAGDDVWSEVLRVIDTNINRHTFHTWFVPTALVEDQGAVLVVSGPAAQTDLFADWIEKHYGDVVRAAVQTVRPGARVEFVRQQRKSG